MIRVVYSDDFLMVIDKPPGLVSTSSETQYGSTLEDILKTDFKIDVERSGIVHRLDKDTSGLMVVAKNLESKENLQAQFKGREVQKQYLALVHGWVESGGKVEAAIGRNPKDREKFAVFTSEGKFRADSGQNIREAVTEYEPVELLVMGSQFIEEIFVGFNKIQIKKLERANYKQFTFLRCKPLTGRTHQIRVHLKYLGFPIVGDEKYGGRRTARLDKRWCKRQFLHAAHLEFNHPKSGERLKFDSSLPEDLERALGTLEKLKS